MIDVRGITYRYPESDRLALDAVDLRVESGTITLLEGDSGSGKTTLLRILAGLTPAFHGGRCAGSGTVAGIALRTATPAEITMRVGLVFQDPEAQGVMAEVLADVAFGPQCHGRPAGEIEPAARAALARVRAEHLIGRRLETLSSGERQRVAIAAILAVDPSVLLLDEPTAQLDDDAACDLVGVLAELRDRGLTIVIGEHRSDRVGHLADTIVRLEGGRRVPPTARVELDPPACGPLPGDGAARLVLEEIRASRGGSHSVTADARIRPGSVVGLTGPNGSGKSTLLRAIAGLEPLRGGRVLLDGRDLAAVPTERRVPAIAAVPQDPGRSLLHSTVADEVATAARALRRGPGTIEAAVTDLELEPLLGRHPLDCSVGERERIAIAAALALEPDLLLLDEPTRGMDRRRRLDLARTLRGVAERGGAVLVASHDLDLLRRCCDSLWTIQDGTLVTAERIAPATLREPVR